MAGAAPPQPPPEQASSKKKSRKKNGKEPLQWTDTFLSEDPFSLLSGSDQGGFLSLEEIDESEYGLIGEVVEAVGEEKWSKKKASSLSNSHKRKRGDEKPSELVSAAVASEGGDKGKKKRKDNNTSKDVTADAQGKEEAKMKKRKNKKENKKKTNQKEDKTDNIVKADVQDGRELLLGEDEVYAWNELRLHPLLINSIRRLGFKEPTPIQKACIPAAAHQGKDVIGAAETGSGKTLAFGLPILQRLLEEREKDARLTLEDKNLADKKSSTESPLRALILTPTRELALQVCDHLKQAAKSLEIYVVPIVGGMSSEKQERLLRRRPHIVVGTPGRLWELMSSGEQHLVELHSLSFFVLDEADRMIERGHYHELQSIIDMLPVTSGPGTESSNSQSELNVQRKKRQTFVFSATIALSDNFRKKLKRGISTSGSISGGLSSIETLSERAGMRPDAAVVDLTNASIVANKLEECFIMCGEEEKDAYLYYILSVHGQGRTMVFCTSIAALRHISAILQNLGINSWTLHAQMQQRARLKAMDRFCGNENSVLIATDVAARGLDIPHVRTVIHYQLPHSAEVYIHRSGRTARAFADGCSIALISAKDKTKFFSLCKSLSKESLKQFPVDNAYMPEVMKRLSLARQVDKITRKNSQENAKKNWFEKNAEALGLDLDVSDSEEGSTKGIKEKKTSSAQLHKLQQELNAHLKQPLQPKTLSHRYLAGAGVSTVLQQQLEELSKSNAKGDITENNKKTKFVVIGQDLVEPLQALRSAGHEVCVNLEKKKEVHKRAEIWKKKKRDEKKRNFLFPLLFFAFFNFSPCLFTWPVLGGYQVRVSKRERPEREQRKACNGACQVIVQFCSRVAFVYISFSFLVYCVGVFRTCGILWQA
ncbi:DEAD-box ATP-dependent RNA helicase 13 [Carex littledalei]|uniref:DEAD-box ATP-dependent RNA helicase 13 n=1 Tax=Carex littledalei TaxID=544730 RepID=A0A833V0A3_9POAL|nr:DEAD-box ATP-dependent RNA helicase 13 [Carex littledalei]